jgi:hypothetical protein
MTNSPYTLESATNDDIEFIYHLRIQTMKPFLFARHGGQTQPG